MFAYCNNNPVNFYDPSGALSFDYDNDDVSDETDEEFIPAGSQNTQPQKGALLPSGYYIGKHAPKFGTPYSSYTNYSYNTYTHSYEESTAYYDYAGRLVIRIDWTNHGRIDHGNPHVHIYEYSEIYRDGIETRLN